MMDQWELLIQGYPAAADPRAFSKALQMATDVLKSDLADFELERLFNTLMQAPVNLLSTVVTQYQDEDWSNSIMAAFKLLGAHAAQYHDVMEPYFENIVKICRLPHTPSVRRYAIPCQTAVARVSTHGASRAQSLVSQFESATTGKTELALLIGTLCEFHPRVVEDQVTTIWRTYLGFLSSNALTDKFVSSVLQGVSGLLASFGSNLAVSELWGFYDSMVKLHGRCRTDCITILRLHASLFKERVADDVTTRAMLWSIATEDGVAGALISVYEAMAEVKGNGVKSIIEKEVLPQLSTSNKLQALSLLSALRGRGFEFDLEGCVDVQNLEFELRESDVSYYIADLVSWYIRSGLSHSLRLSQTALLFYQHLPVRKLGVVADAILSHREVREEAISFLASECSQPNVETDDYIPIWRALLVDNPNQRKSEALQEYIDYVTFVVESWLEEGGEVLPQKIATLLTLTSDILSLPVSEASYEMLSLAVSDALRQCRAAELLAVTAAVLVRGGTIQDDVWPHIQVERCRTEAELCACCGTLQHAPHHVPAAVVLPALQIIFARHDVEDVTLLQAVKKLESLLADAEVELEEEFRKAISLVQKLQGRKAVDKDSRVLQRHITMFLGKYGGKIDTNNNLSDVRMVAGKLRDSLFLAIPHLETDRVKMNLQEVLQLAIEKEDQDVLLQLLRIICANLSYRRDPTAISAVSSVCRSLCRVRCRDAASVACCGRVRRALAYCDATAVHDVLTHISEEVSPGVRRQLCSMLAAMLSGELLASAASRASSMLGASGTTKRAGMDMIDALLPVLEDDHALLKSHLPQILERISKANELEAMSTFENTTKLFLDKLVLFDVSDVDSLLRNLISTLTIGPKTDNDIEIYRKTVDICIGIVKSVAGAGKTEYSRVVEIIFEITDTGERDLFKSLYVLAILKNKFEFGSSYSSTMFFNKTILKELYEVEIYFCEDNRFKLEAILIFMREYAETLLEYDYEKTTRLLSTILRDAPVQTVVNHDKSLQGCVSVYKTILKSFPRAMEESFESWLSELPVPQIRQHFIEESQYVVVKALNIYMDMSGIHLHSLTETLKTWPKHVLRKYIDGAAGRELSFLTDCLAAAVKVTGFNVKSLLLEGRAAGDTVGVKFCAKFMNVLLRSFLKKPYVLLENDVGGCCAVLDDVVKFCVKRKCGEVVNGEVIDLVNEVWPTYETKTSFQQKCDLLGYVSRLPKSLARESNPTRWVAEQLATASREDCIRLVGVLPGGDEFADCYASFAQRCLCARVSECGAGVRAALDALAAKPSQKLLYIVAKLAAADDTKALQQDKWWMKALDSCCASLARHGAFKAADELLQMGDDSLTLGVCRRLMLPFLRYSTSSYCEQFFCRHLKTLLEHLTRKPRDTRPSRQYHQCVVERTRALMMLQVAFEKIPLSTLQSPQSLLYRELNLAKPISNYLTATVCKLCVTLREEECPPGAPEEFRDSFRQYQCAIYNCLCAAICKSKPADKFYDHIIGWKVWSKITDDDQFHLPVQRRRRKIRQPVSISISNTTKTASTLATNTRTKMFLRTLSEDPRKFDLYSQEIEEVETQELRLSDAETNRHTAAGTLCALLSHTSELTCWGRVCDALCNSLSTHHSFLLAQAVCNCHEVLTPHARLLRPALLAFAANTMHDGRLNGLHVDVIETLTHWRDDPTLPASSAKDLQNTVGVLIKEAINSKDMFLQLLDSFLEVYSKYVSVDWSVLSRHIDGQDWRCLPILQRLTKHKIHIPELASTLLQIDLKHWLQDIRIAEVFGAALACEGESEEPKKRFRDMLKRVKQSELYVKMLYYAQLGCKTICDEVNFRQVTDQTGKLPKHLQNKCLHILSTYISQHQRPTDNISSMFETIELSEFLTTDNVEALTLVAEGLRLMRQGLKRRVVKQALEYCSHSSGKVRKAAFAVAAAAFRDLFHSESSEEPSAKRLKRPTLLTMSEETDHYVASVASRVAAGVTSGHSDVIDAVNAVLSKGAGERLAECFSLLLSAENPAESDCAAILELFFSDLRRDERFLACKLREDPLEPIELKGTANLFTDAKTCRGTLLSYRASGPRRRTKVAATPAVDIDVQVSIDSILDSLLQFAKRQPSVALALTLQTVRGLSGRGFDTRAAIASLLTAKLASSAGRLYVPLARLVIDCAVTSPRFVDAVARLNEDSYLSDDAELVRCLYEEMRMRKDIGIYEIRSQPMPSCDVQREGNDTFSLQELTSCFGRLANWEDLTLQQKAAKSSDLPVLWAGEEAFKAALDVYKVSRSDPVSWFDKLVSSYHEETQNSARWLLDSSTWPRRRFHQSAVAEALSWQLDTEPWPCEMSPKDCLVEWSARLMIRAAQASEREAIYPSHSNELVWCVRANEMALHRAVLQCCQRNDIIDLSEEEQISWQHQKLLALHGMALERNDSDILKDALQTAEHLVWQISEQTPDSVGIFKLYLQQNIKDMDSKDIDRILDKVNGSMENSTLVKTKPTLMRLYEMALMHYHRQWTDDQTKQVEVIANLSSALHRMRASNLGPSDRHVALLINRLQEYKGSRIDDDDIKNMVLQVFYPQHQCYDDFTTEQMSDLRYIFGLPPERKIGRDYKQLLATIRDVGYCLLKYCEGLMRAVEKRDQWSEIFDRIRDMFENPYAGSHYQLLIEQKDKLYSIADYDAKTKESKLEVLRLVMKALDQPVRTTLRVSQLCPSLMTRTGELARLLPRGDVVRIEDQVTVITNSIRRPCIITALTSLGPRVRFVHKSGESLKRDASVLRLDPHAQYKVTPTSEDSGLMDYLEDHQTLYSLISTVCDLDEISASVQRPADGELIVTPSPHTYRQLREKVPVHALRTALERNSSCIEDFLMKIRNFQDSLATTAVFNWILGLGDRHLENLLCSARGQLVSIDCGAALRFTSELPPARCTPCLLAATTNTTVFEARLQSALSRFRAAAPMFCNFVRTTFAWSPDEIHDMLPHIEALVSGTRLSHHVTRDLVESSRWTYKEAYVKLIDEVFAGHEVKDQYTVVEQISCFLLHCTSVRILQVTRSGWTPWV